jgi:hypothetical protein
MGQRRVTHLVGVPPMVIDIARVPAGSGEGDGTA